MTAVGFRCFGNEVSVVVLSGDLAAPNLEEHYHCPLQGQDRPAKLVYLRQEVHEVLQRHQPTMAMFKAAEGTAQAARQRLEAEGVLQEAVASNGVRVRGQTKAQVKAAIGWTGMARDVIDALAAHGLGHVPTNQKEAALAALAALRHA